MAPQPIVQPTLVGSTPRVQVYHADALRLMDRLRAESITPTLIFMDPPFNQRVYYPDWEDDLDRGQYFEYLKEWIEYANGILADCGSLWLNLPDEWAADAVTIARDLYDLYLENWCIWHYRFGQHQPNRFIRSKTHALWFSRGEPIVNREAALVPSDRAAIYFDPRIYETDNGGTRMDFDVWGFEPYWGRVQGNNKERRRQHPNQLPELYLKRIIGVCTNPGDIVLDPFCGSGTTAVVADALKRYAITGDITRYFAESAFQRIKEGAVRV